MAPAVSILPGTVGFRPTARRRANGKNPTRDAYR
jgi:hypothetical protein